MNKVKQGEKNMTCKNHRKPDILYRDLHTPHSLIIDSLFVFFYYLPTLD